MDYNSAQFADGHHPVGTLEQARKAGFDPRVAITCHDPKADPNVKGCPQWDRCIFAQERYGGFRGLKVSNIGYSIHLAEWPKNRPANEDQCSCFVFMSTLVARMNYGIALRETQPEKPREDIEIVAQEGENIWFRGERVKEPGNDKSPMELFEEKRIVRTFPTPDKVVEPKGLRADIMKEREAEKKKAEPAVGASRRAAV